ncbi:MAG TPA: hypothetical protein VGQ62_01520, partial [Chloroflexota bacterium]|nr:hypothetical protein [Chloroflexota bacterium]
NNPVMRRLTACLMAAVIGTLMLGSVALADATPIQLILLYMPNVSNTGSSSASGIAELVMPEGEVRISAADLPRLDGDKQYVAWVINSETNQYERLGAFNSAQSTGAVHYETVLPDAIPNNHWNLLLVTIEASATPTRPSSKHSIAGVFPRGENEPLPGVLPNTGGELGSGSWEPGYRADWLLAAGPAALTLLAGFAAGYVLAKRHMLTPNSQIPTPKSQP